MKTAGTSVEVYFEDACLPPGTPVIQGRRIGQTITPAGIIGSRGLDPSSPAWYHHMPAKAIRDMVGDAVWNAYFKFCVVRNPFDKMVSFWWFRHGKSGCRYDQRPFTKVRADFASWCVEHTSEAIDRDKYLIDGDVVVDFFIRYESLLDGLRTVCRQVGYPFLPERLGRFKGDFRLIGQPFSAYYDQASIEAVEAAFAWELDYFGYDRLSAGMKYPATQGGDHDVSCI